MAQCDRRGVAQGECASAPAGGGELMRLTATLASVGQQQPLPQSQQQDAEEAPTVGTGPAAGPPPAGAGPVAGAPPVAVFATTTGRFSTTRTIMDFDGMLRQSRSDNMYI